MPTDGLLDVIRRERPEDLANAKVTPATRPARPPEFDAGTFLFATGVECSYPTIDGGRVRRDLLAECGHYDHGRQPCGSTPASGTPASASRQRPVHGRRPRRPGRGRAGQVHRLRVLGHTPATNGPARLDGPGPTTFTACHVTDWARGTDPAAPAVDARGGSLTLNGCQFLAPGKRHLSVGNGVRSALVFGNTFAAGAKVDNAAGPRARVSVNADV